MINILIIEDNANTSAHLKNILDYKKEFTHTYINEIDIVDSYEGATIALDTQHPTKYSLIFWDIMLNGKESLALAPYFEDCILVIFSSYNRYLKDVYNMKQLKAKIMAMDSKDKRELINFKKLSEKDLIKEINKSTLQQPKEFQLLSIFIMVANKNFGETISFTQSDRMPKTLTKGSIVAVMSYNPDYISINPNPESEIEFNGRKLILTNNNIFVTNKGEGKGDLDDFLGLVSTNGYFKRINLNFVINIESITEIKKIGSVGFVTLDFIKNIESTVYFPYQKNLYSKHKLTTKPRLTSIEITDHYELKLLDAIETKRLKLKRNA